MENILDCAIIGGGPGGLTAGLYATRGGLRNVVLFEMGMPGGQITKSSEIENYPGFFDHTKTGMDFMDTWQKQCFHFGLKHEMKKVESVKKIDKLFEINLEDGKTVKSKTVIVATGSNPKEAGFNGEKEFFGRGVSTCATCDGFFYKNKEVTVLGGGDTALEEALYLSNICSKVHVVHRRDTFRAAPSTIERVMKKENINLITNATIDKIIGDESGVNGARLKTKESFIELNTPGIFVFVGYNVNNKVLRKEGKENSFICNTNGQGQVVVDLKMHTSLSGLFAIGDMRIDAPKQVVSAAGDGSIAALEAISYIQEEKYL